MLSNQTTTFPLSNWDRFVVALARYLAALVGSPAWMPVALWF